MKPPIRIFILDTYYQDFLNSYYQKSSVKENLKFWNYQELKKDLLNQMFGTSNFYSEALNTLGCIAEDFIANDEIQQKKWAEEHGMYLRLQNELYKYIPRLRRYRQENWVYPILEAQIRNFKPDIVYNKNIGFIDPDFLALIKKKYNIKIVGQIASRLSVESFFEPYDLIISSLPHYVEMFKKCNIPSSYIQLAFEPKVLEKVTKKNSFEITHIGGYGPIHNERNEILESTAKKIKIDFWGYGTKNLPPQSPIFKSFHGPIWGIDMFNILFNSKITVTKHISKVANNYANNLTLYEATGCGCLLLTDAKDNLADILIPGKEVETYTSVDELIEKARYYLEHEDKRQIIASAGQKRTLTEHTYLSRAKQIIKSLEKILQ